MILTSNYKTTENVTPVKIDTNYIEECVKDNYKIALIKAIREFSGDMGLKDAKEAIEGIMNSGLNEKNTIANMIGLFAKYAADTTPDDKMKSGVNDVKATYRAMIEQYHDKIHSLTNELNRFNAMLNTIEDALQILESNTK